MRVLVAPASFKESLSAADAARAMADGARRAGAEVVELPLADGGRGTTACLAQPMGLAMREVRAIPGGGAAGGLGAGAVAFLGARLEPGADWVLAALGVGQRLAGVDLVLTGEGRFDAQSLAGKAPMALARLAGAAGVPCVVIAGSVGPGCEPALAQGATVL